MQAAVRTQYGPPNVLTVREMEKPQPGADEILVRVMVATVNRTDCGILTGTPPIIKLFTGFPKPKRKITGSDFAGDVVAVGKNVRHFKPGNRVWGFNDNGCSSHAEYMIVKETDAIATIPDGVSYEVAAASPEGAHYAYNFISKVKLEPGMKVMVYGASGAIGSAMVQLLKYMGAYVTAVCDTKNLERVKDLGADRVVDYTATDFTKDEEQYPFVFDAVGKSSFGACKPLLLPKGIYISSELGPGNENLYLPLLTAIKGGKRVVFPVPSNIKRTIQFVRKMLEEGKFRPLIDRSFPLQEIIPAFEYVASGQKTGNVLLKMN